MPQLHKQQQPPNSTSSETLRRHQEMYERRLRMLKRTGGQSSREQVDNANDPSTFRDEGEDDLEYGTTAPQEVR